MNAVRNAMFKDLGDVILRFLLLPRRRSILCVFLVREVLLCGRRSRTKDRNAVKNAVFTDPGDVKLR